MAPIPQQPSWFSHPLLFLSLQAGGFCIAFGTSSQNFPFSTKHCTPKHARKHSALSSTKLPGQFKGCCTEGRACRGGAELHFCRSSLLPWLPHTTQPPYSFPSQQPDPITQKDTARAGGGSLPPGSACRSPDFIFIYYYSLLLFICSFLFLFHFEHAQLCHLGFAENVNRKSSIQMQPFIAWIHFPSSTAPVLPPWN